MPVAMSSTAGTLSGTYAHAQIHHVVVGGDRDVQPAALQERRNGVHTDDRGADTYAGSLFPEVYETVP